MTQWPLTQREPPIAQEARSGGEPEGDAGCRWMVAFQRGDREAFNRIVLHYQEGVRQFIGRYLGDADRVDDLAQEAFLRVYRARRRYRPTARFHTWLFTIVTRLCLNEIRSRSREKKNFAVERASPAAASGERPSEDLLQSVADRRGEDPESALERRELEEVLRNAIGRLPGNQRAAILLLQNEETPYHEIAAALGVSVMAVKSLLNRARESLRKCLEDYRDGKRPEKR
ncbi:MAG: sigma-70 family RNA polymerase sigma factor [Planctomycetes bacterium]|nr:sigma-70 family RNA polymerase sigma factor [Planctomycetota bacterium]